MSDNIINIGDFSVARKDSKWAYPKKCHHHHLQMDDHGQTLKCTDCGDNISAYWAIGMFAEHIEKEMKKLKCARDLLIEDQHKSLHLTAARKVEKAWRKRDMLPCCPHCGEGIAPEDGLGGSMINRKFARRPKTNPTEAKP